MKKFTLYFTAARSVEIREEVIGLPSDGQVRVRTLLSSISPGTEMLIYRGQAPRDMELDDNISALDGTFSYPFQYGYSSVGEIDALGRGVDEKFLGQQVFSFHPHESHYLTKLSEVMTLPADISLENAVFLPNMETAVNFVMDGKPIIGECVVVLGLGVVGLLTTALLSQFPSGCLVAFDLYQKRREAALPYANVCLDPTSAEVLKEAQHWFAQSGSPGGADLIFELSGSPETINQAIALGKFDSRIVIGSWYGSKRAALDLGGWFHRSRIKLVSSQVSTLAAEFSGRWDKGRRLAVAWKQLAAVNPARWISHHFPIEKAAEAYRLIDEQPDETMQVVLTYSSL